MKTRQPRGCLASRLADNWKALWGFLISSMWLVFVTPTYAVELEAEDYAVFGDVFEEYCLAAMLEDRLVVATDLMMLPEDMAETWLEDVSGTVWSHPTYSDPLKSLTLVEKLGGDRPSCTVDLHSFRTSGATSIDIKGFNSFVSRIGLYNGSFVSEKGIVSIADDIKFVTFEGISNSGKNLAITVSFFKVSIFASISEFNLIEEDMQMEEGK